MSHAAVSTAHTEYMSKKHASKNTPENAKEGKKSSKPDKAKKLPKADSGRSLDTLPELLTSAELAHFMSVKVETVYYWRRARRGPRATVFGNVVRYHRDNVRAFLDLYTEAEGER